MCPLRKHNTKKVLFPKLILKYRNFSILAIHSLVSINEGLGKVKGIIPFTHHHGECTRTRFCVVSSYPLGKACGWNNRKRARLTAWGSGRWSSALSDLQQGI